MHNKNRNADFEKEKASERDGAAASNDLIGKEYQFISSTGFGLTGDVRIYNTVKVAEDRIYIETRPKRKNVTPVILFEDMLSIDMKWMIAPAHLLMAALLVVIGIVCLAYGAVAGIALLLFGVLWVWIGLNKKIVISQRNGIKVNLLQGRKGNATEFKEDMQKLTKII